ncbi:MAG: peptide-methionine (S)-S-oxide reductase MsrA, partial [Halobacteriovoraceae bacterium]|nr:peptide-methionine (S)-S-oxide reductase MsrA [Halobacteriovoraceae bacterium]
GAGCFWGVEETYRTTSGVVETSVGYSGGKLDSPDYRSVCGGETGHAEVVEVTFDPEKIGLEEILEIFWNSHNPTTLNKQGPDVGSQYRSAIFTYSTEQIEKAEKSKRAVDESKKWPNPIVTEILPAKTYWRAEEYHQKYFLKNGGGSCNF